MIQPNSRIDAVRGCVAITRGPLVYCLEEADLPAGIELEDIRLDPAAEPALRPLPGTIPGSLAGLALQVGSALAVPYFAWGNRGSGAMRVWIPVSAAERSTP